MKPECNNLFSINWTAFPFRMSPGQFLFFSIILLSCSSATDQPEGKAGDPYEKKDTSATKNAIDDSGDIQFSRHHLQDTFIIKGDFIVFLRPDSIRFENYANEDENIYEADSDFGFGISATIDSIAGNKRYKGIHTAVSDKRYILIEDCKTCPQLMDRDTINYGLIMTSKGKAVWMETNLHSGDYLQDINKFFGLDSR